MYEGRTRGKKLKYTYSDDEDMFSDGLPSRRSTRNASSNVTPAEPSRPRFTASGRQIRSRAGGLYGETLLAGQREDSEFDEEEDEGRPQRTRTSINPDGYSGYRDDDLEDESEAAPSEANDSGREWGVEDDEDEFEGDDEGDNVSGNESIANGEPQSLVVQLRYGKGNVPGQPKVAKDEPPSTQDTQMKDASQTETSPPSLPSLPPQSKPLPTPAPVPHVPQPAPTLDAPLMPSGSNPQQAPANMATIPSASTLPIPTPIDAPNPSQPAEANGLNGHTTSTESRPVPGISHPQAPFTQGGNQTS